MRAASPAPAIAESVRLGPAGEPADLLIEVPHGATARRHFDELAARLAGPLPDDLAAFFHVNTDEGAPELAAEVARALAGAWRVRVVRALVPRTLIDVNRVVEGEVAAGMTAGLPAYLRDPADRALLLDLHARYTALAADAYAETCGAGGLALALHTYAPRSVEVEIGDDVVAALRAAYRPAALGRWRLRPEIDLITRAPDGEDLSPRALADELAAGLRDAGWEVAENSTYTLHPASTGHRHARRWPGRVLCVEVRRDLLGDPWIPFEPSPIDAAAVARLAAPLAAALDRALRRRAAAAPQPSASSRVRV